MKKMRIEAIDTNWESVFDFLSEEMSAAGCDMEFIYTVAIAAEEIFVNVCHYAYQPATGMVTVGIDASDRVLMRFEDEGVPYDPLAKADPNVALSAESREVGGLGIFMVKQMMDEVAYCYEDGKNIFQMAKAMPDQASDAV